MENLEPTIADIKQNETAKDRNVISNYDDFIDNFQLAVKIQSIGSRLEKAKYYYFHEKKVLEMNALFDTYCKIKASNLSNEDLRTTTLTDYTTGSTLTLEGVEQRLTTLGWKG